MDQQQNIQIAKNNYYKALNNRYYLYLFCQKITPIILIFFNGGSAEMRIVGYSVVGTFELLSLIYGFMFLAIGKATPVFCRVPRRNKKRGLELPPTPEELAKKNQQDEKSLRCSVYWGIIIGSIFDTVCFFYYGVYAIVYLSEGKGKKYLRFLLIYLTHFILTFVFYCSLPKVNKKIITVASEYNKILDVENFKNDQYKLVFSKFMRGDYLDLNKILISNGNNVMQGQPNLGVGGGFNNQAKY